MKRIKLESFISLAILLTLTANRANALPGDTVEAVTAWIAAHPTLQPGIGDGLTVRKSNTAAQRFTFEARVLPPGQIAFPTDRSVIRSEQISLYDMINGVTPDRLRESLRVIYGPAIYQDYERAKLVYSYPSPETVDLARRQNRPLLAAQQGELLLGDSFAYWIEVTQTTTEKAYNGHLTIFLREDLDKLETELRD